MLECVFNDIYACYDVLFVMRWRQYYILQFFGNDIGMIVLDYIGIGKGYDIQQLIDSVIHNYNQNKKNDEYVGRRGTYEPPRMIEILWYFLSR